MAAGQDVHGLLLNVGGDLCVRGDAPRSLGIAAPWADSESAEPLAILQVKDRAVSTSGSSQRGFRIGSEWYSHIIDPRSGMPVAAVSSATVVAPRSIDADALATICNVLDPEESLRLVRSLRGVECLIITAGRRVLRSAGWSRYELASAPPPGMPASAGQPPSSSPAPAAPGNAALWGRDFELQVDFEINQPDGQGRRYRRPYVAIWVENKDGYPVRNLTLWVSQGGAGPFQWLPDLKRWYRADQERKHVEKKDLIFSTARPTRPPGKYKVVWDGKDDHGKLLPQGEYTILIDAAREHGTYQNIRKTVTLGAQPFDEPLPGNLEIKSATLSYRRKAAAPPRPPGDLKRSTTHEVFPVTRRPLSRRLAIRFAKLARWLHIYVSMFGLAVVLFFSATGITLNHPDWFFGEAERTTQSEGSVNARWLRGEPPAAEANSESAAEASSQVNKLEVVEFLRRTHGIRGALADFRVDEAECVVAFKGPGYAADAFIDRDSGHYTLSQTFHGVIAVLNDLHKGRDTGPVWSILVDASAIVLTLISLSGLILLFYLKLRRTPGLAVAVAGAVVAVVLFFMGVP